jgi:hypothetical protein
VFGVTVQIHDKDPAAAEESQNVTGYLRMISESVCLFKLLEEV